METAIERRESIFNELAFLIKDEDETEMDLDDLAEARQNIKNSLKIKRRRCCKTQQAEIDFLLRHL